jgi:ferric-dicitrate binding protein FerR (iron transport regulator)
MSKRYHLPVDVETFTEPRWARVERDVFAVLDDPPEPRRARLPPRALVFAVLASVAGVVVFLVVHGLSRPPSMGDPVRLATRESASRFSIGESSIEAAADSLVLVRGDDERGIDVVVDHGRIDCEVAPRHGRPPFVVDAGEVRVRVVGTAFSVTHDAKSTSVEVSHGVVEVITGGVVTTLHDGDRWQDGAAPTHVSASPSDARAEDSALSAAVPAAVPPPAARGSSEPASGVRTAARSAAIATVAAPAVAPSPAGPSPMQPWPDDASPKPGPRTATGEDEFNAAARIERKDPDRAASIYQGLAASRSDWAPNALFALAHLEAQRGHRAPAAELLRTYLARYPHGLNVDDARTLLQQVQ